MERGSQYSHNPSSNSHSPYPVTQLSGLEEALEYYEIEQKFSRQKPKDGQFVMM